jgi:hypothetical protein
MGISSKFAAVAVCSVAAGWALIHFGVVRNPMEPALYAHCEEVLKKRLKSPSSYNRITMLPREKVVSWQEYERYHPGLKNSSAGRALERLAADGGDKPILSEVFIEYDAKNAYGTLARGTSKCSYANIGDKDVLEFLVKIDGLTHTEWLLAALKN